MPLALYTLSHPQARRSVEEKASLASGFVAKLGAEVESE
jgi:hypothetical protein